MSLVADTTGLDPEQVRQAALIVVSQSTSECKSALQILFNNNTADAVTFAVFLVGHGVCIETRHATFAARWHASAHTCGLTGPSRLRTGNGVVAMPLVHIDCAATSVASARTQMRSSAAAAASTNALSGHFALDAVYRTLMHAVFNLNVSLSAVTELPSVLVWGLLMEGSAHTRTYVCRHMLTQGAQDVPFWTHPLPATARELAVIAMGSGFRGMNCSGDAAASTTLLRTATQQGGTASSPFVDTERDALAAYVYFSATCGAHLTTLYRRMCEGEPTPPLTHDQLIMSLFSLFVDMVCAQNLTEHTVERDMGDTQSLRAGRLLQLDARAPGLVEMLGRSAGRLRLVLLDRAQAPQFRWAHNNVGELGYVVHSLTLAQNAYINETRPSRLDLRCVRTQQLTLEQLHASLLDNLHFSEHRVLVRWLQAQRCVQQQHNKAAPAPLDMVVLRFDVDVRYHELVSTMRYYGTRFPVLQLVERSHVGCDTDGSYMVLEQRTLVMLRHAMLVVSMQRDRRTTHALYNVPLYPLLARAYFTRYSSTTHGASGPGVDAFMLTCFVEALALMLGVELASHDVSSSPAAAAAAKRPTGSSALPAITHRRGILHPGDFSVAVYRWLHRLVAVLHTCGTAAVGTTYAIVNDLPALNAVRAFIQFDLVHTLSRRTLRMLYRDERVQRHAPDAAQLAWALDTFSAQLVPSTLGAVEDAALERLEQRRRLNNKRGAPSDDDNDADQRVRIEFNEQLITYLAARHPAHPLLRSERANRTWLWLIYELVVGNVVRDRVTGVTDVAFYRALLHDLHTNDPLTQTQWRDTTSMRPMCMQFTHTMSYYLTQGWRQAPYVTADAFLSESISVREPCTPLADFVRHLETWHTSGSVQNVQLSDVTPRSFDEFVASNGSGSDSDDDDDDKHEKPRQQQQQRHCNITSALPFHYDAERNQLLTFEDMFIIVLSPAIAKALHHKPSNDVQALIRQRATNHAIDLVQTQGMRLAQVRSETLTPVAQQPYAFASLQSFEMARLRLEQVSAAPREAYDRDAFFRAAITAAGGSSLSSSLPNASNVPVRS